MQPALASQSALVRYPREAAVKFARRNQIATYASPLMRAAVRFSGYLAAKAPVREQAHDLYGLMMEDIDGKGSSIDTYWSVFSVEAKARGSMLLQVEMPQEIGTTAAEQMERRRIPYWMQIAPESVTDYALGDDGKFDFVEYKGQFEARDGTYIDCTWRFDRMQWQALDEDRNVLGGGGHPLRECPVLIFTESGDFPCFGSFASIADVARRLFNAESELDEILRGATFPVLHQQVPEGTTNDQKLAAAKVIGETIGVHNLLVWSGSSPPGFIAPPDGPARVYLDLIKRLESRIDEIGLNVAAVNQQESGIAMRMRFAAINAELSRFAGRLENLERRAWDLSRRWLGFSSSPTVQWHRDFNLADVEQELRILQSMQASAMPAEVIAEQQQRIVSVQFAGVDSDRMEQITQAITERRMEPRRAAQPIGAAAP